MEGMGCSYINMTELKSERGRGRGRERERKRKEGEGGEREVTKV